MANTFAQQHSLSKLAQSLKLYWSLCPPLAQEEAVEWEECMSSLLEVASSVALMTGEKDVLSVLDADTYAGVTEVKMRPSPRSLSLKSVVLAKYVAKMFCQCLSSMKSA